MVHPLEGPRLKIERASEHLDALKEERSVFLANVGDRIVGHFERETGYYIFNVGGDPPPIRWAPIVGEIGHNLRSSLDNLTCALVRRRGNTVTKQNQFVIADTEDDWNAEIKRKRLRGLNQDDVTLIQSLQPYRRGDALNHPLSRLGWLNNLDKHPDFHVSYMTMADMFPLPERLSHPVPLNDDTGQMVAMWLGGPGTDDRTEIARCLLVNTGPDPQMRMELCNPIDISLSDRERALTLDDLVGIREEVTRIYGMFEPLLR